MRNSAKRDEIIKCSSKLFNQYGFKAVGIDRIIEESKIAKMTMYHHFSSKDELIVEVLSGFNQTLSDEILKPIEEKKWTSQKKLKKLLDLYQAWFLSDEFYGCPFHKALAEFPEKRHPIHFKVQEHQDILKKFIYKQVKSVNLTSQILIVLEGSIINAKINSGKTSAKDAWKIISHLLEHGKKK